MRCWLIPVTNPWGIVVNRHESGKISWHECISQQPLKERQFGRRQTECVDDEAPFEPAGGDGE